jgi:hypothetical protein
MTFFNLDVILNSFFADEMQNLFKDDLDELPRDDRCSGAAMDLVSMS